MTVHEVPKVIAYQGEKYLLTDLCRKFGLQYQLVYTRLRAGWSVVDAIEKPVRQSSPTTRELKRYEYLGEMLTIEELAQKSLELGVASAVPGPLIRARLLKGWSVEDAVEEAPLPKGNRRRHFKKQQEPEGVISTDTPADETPAPEDCGCPVAGCPMPEPAVA